MTKLRAPDGLRLEDLRGCYTLGCSSEVLDLSNLQLNIQGSRGVFDPIRSLSPEEERALWFRAIRVVPGEQPLTDCFLSFQVRVEASNMAWSRWGRWSASQRGATSIA